MSLRLTSRMIIDFSCITLRSAGPNAERHLRNSAAGTRKTPCSAKSLLEHFVIRQVFSPLPRLVRHGTRPALVDSSQALRISHHLDVPFADKAHQRPISTVRPLPGVLPSGTARVSSLSEKHLKFSIRTPRMKMPLISVTRKTHNAQDMGRLARNGEASQLPEWAGSSF